MTTRDKEMHLLGQLESIRFPLASNDVATGQAYYDLIDSIVEQYKQVLKERYPDIEA